MSKADHLEFKHDIETYRAEIGRGNVPGAQVFGGFGSRDIATASSADIWPGPTAIQPIPPSTGIQMEVVSSAATDAVGGTGISMVELHYISATTGDESAEIITLTGTTPVNTVATDIMFVQCVHAWDAGTTLAADGNISVRDTAGTITYSYIPIGETRCSSAARMVPRGKRGFLDGAIGGSASGAGKRAILRIQSNSIDGDIVNGGTIFFPQGTAVTQDNSAVAPFDPAFGFPEYSIIKMTAVTTGASYVSGTWWGYWEDE